MILLGLTGSVASTLGGKIIEQLKKYDSQVEVILTQSALPFVDLSEITKLANAVWLDKDEWSFGQYKKDDRILHIDLRNRADMLVIAPASANTIAKIENGICDNLLTSVVRAWDMQKRIVLAPSMNTYMWKSPITQKQIQTLQSYGFKIVNPQIKKLACGDFGDGALADISKIVSRVTGGFNPVDKWWFPLRDCNCIPINPHPGAFGYTRKNSRHTGVDLYTQEHSPVYAVEPGKIVSVEHFTGEWDNSPWWKNTDCILVEGETGVICYGEITTKRTVGEYVKKGEHIANVSRVIKEGREHPEITGWSPCMLHLELYKHGTTCASSGFTDSLLDPTEYLISSYSRPDKIVTYDLYKPQ